MSIFPPTSLWILLVKFARVAFEIVCFWSAAVCSLFFSLSLSLIINRSRSCRSGIWRCANSSIRNNIRISIESLYSLSPGWVLEDRFFSDRCSTVLAARYNLRRDYRFCDLALFDLLWSLNLHAVDWHAR